MDEIDELYQSNQRLVNINTNKNNSNTGPSSNRDLNDINGFLLNEHHHVFGEPDMMHTWDW